MSVTIEDVARKAGVSTMTVSRALRDSPLVASYTKSKILQVAQQLGYRPNLLARSLVQKQSPLISLIIPEVSNPFFAPIIAAVQETAWKHNYFVAIADTEREVSKQEAYLSHFQQLQISGMIITPLTLDLDPLRALRESGTPVVVIARRWQEGDYVTADNIIGGKMVAEHLIELGHKRFGCVSIREFGHTAIADRVSGFVETLQQAGFDVPETQMLKTDTLRIEEGIQIADAFLELPDPPTAVFVVADRLAVGFVDRLIQHGVRIPDDLSVVGYDDIRYSAFLKVPLTTVALPKEEIGHIATEILVKRITEPDSHSDWRQVLLQPELVVRQSSASVARTIDHEPGHYAQSNLEGG